MRTADIDDVGTFIARYRRFTEALHSQYVDQFRTDFRRLQVGSEDVLAQAAAERRLTASTFNIFQVLDRTYDEVRTHSRFLANLLDPQGSHSQGSMFLEIFLRQNKDAFPNAPELCDPLPADGWEVKTEWSMAYGAMELVISSSRLGYLCIIENKLLAGEQPDQLARYSCWLQEQLQYPHRALFYLTPNGRQSDTSGGAIYHPLSYRGHIVAWLEEALPKVKAPRLVDLLNQYLEVLNDL